MSFRSLMALHQLLHSSALLLSELFLLYSVLKARFRASSLASPLLLQTDLKSKKSFASCFEAAKKSL